MGAVPRPPAGLADRIKNDIPKYLQAEPERERFSRSIAFSMRVAASILLLITSVFVTLNLIEPAAKRTAERNASVQLTPAVMKTAPATPASADTAAPAEEIRLEMTEALPQPSTPAAPRPAPQVAERGVDDALATRSNEPARARDEGTLSVTAEAPVAETFAFAPEVAAPAPVAPPPPPATAADAPRRTENVAPPLVIAQERDAEAGSGFFVREAKAASLDLAPRKNVFGIAVDPEVFRRIKSMVENGERPSQSAIDLEALINYFAGAPAKPPRRGVRLEVEASPVPVKVEGDHAVLRFTVDTPALASEDGASMTPIARDAKIEVDLNRGAVAAFHRVGDGDAIAAEDVLLSNVSVTALYDLELRPHLKANERVATVTLHYRSVDDGRSHDIERVIRGRDLAGSWSHASRRHRLASLGAVWGESLKKSSAPGVDVAHRAKELVSQNPKDPLARELADAANATGGER